MAMPETPMDENNALPARHDDIGCTRKGLSVKSIWDFKRPKYLAHRLLWSRMTLPHARHQSASLRVNRIGSFFVFHRARANSLANVITSGARSFSPHPSFLPEAFVPPTSLCAL
jgi:hypothetical protein